MIDINSLFGWREFLASKLGRPQKPTGFPEIGYRDLPSKLNKEFISEMNFKITEFIREIWNLSNFKNFRFGGFIFTKLGIDRFFLESNKLGIFKEIHSFFYGSSINLDIFKGFDFLWTDNWSFAFLKIKSAVVLKESPFTPPFNPLDFRIQKMKDLEFIDFLVQHMARVDLKNGQKEYERIMKKLKEGRK